MKREQVVLTDSVKFLLLSEISDYTICSVLYSSEKSFFTVRSRDVTVPYRRSYHKNYFFHEGTKLLICIKMRLCAVVILRLSGNDMLSLGQSRVYKASFGTAVATKLTILI